jgi:glycosyltransferase involved in cell wall biosynthesis
VVQVTDSQPDISLVIPVYNEAACIGNVIEEATGVLDGLERPYEIIVINDGSTDETPTLLARACTQCPALRVIELEQNSGQSAAFNEGFRECRGRVAVLMDGDGQNDPRDIPVLLDALGDDCDACCGYRANRRDTWSKRAAGRWANTVRRCVLHDGIRDAGCSLKAIKREFLEALPMGRPGMHRFIPALLLLQGARIAQLPVNHRARSTGQSKYTNLGRLGQALSDLWTVRRMQKRHQRVSS